MFRHLTRFSPGSLHFLLPENTKWAPCLSRLLKLHGTLVLHELSQSDDTLMTLRSECGRGHNLGFAHYCQACPKRKKRPDALRKMVTNGFMMLFSHVKISLDFIRSLSTPLTWTSRLQSSLFFARLTLENLKPLRSAAWRTHIFTHQCSQFTSVLVALIAPNRKLNGYGISKWEIKCNYFQL